MENIEKEIWKPIVGYEGLYEVSNLGRVRSLDRYVNYKSDGRVKKLRGKLKKITILKSGYYRVALCKDNIEVTKRISRIVLEAFVGECPQGMQACHNDGNKTNNKINNLRWDTIQNNALDKFKHGTVLFGEKNPLSSLTDLQVTQIRGLLISSKFRLFELAKLFNVNLNVICKIKTGLTWCHLKKLPKIKDKSRSLTTIEIDQIINLLNQGKYNLVDIKKKYGVSTAVVSRIKIKDENKVNREVIKWKKLSIEDVHKIKLILKTGKYNKKELASEYNISPCTINDIIHQRSWKRVA